MYLYLKQDAEVLGKYLGEGGMYLLCMDQWGLLCTYVTIAAPSHAISAESACALIPHVQVRQLMHEVNLLRCCLGWWCPSRSWWIGGGAISDPLRKAWQSLLCTYVATAAASQAISAEFACASVPCLQDHFVEMLPGVVVFWGAGGSQ